MNLPKLAASYYNYLKKNHEDKFIDQDGLIYTSLVLSALSHIDSIKVTPKELHAITESVSDLGNETIALVRAISTLEELSGVDISLDSDIINTVVSILHNTEESWDVAADLDKFITNENYRGLLDAFKIDLSGIIYDKEIKEELSIEKRIEGYKPDFSINWKTITEFLIFGTLLTLFDNSGIFSGSGIISSALTLFMYLILYAVGVIIISSKIKKFGSNVWLAHIFGLQFVILIQNILYSYIRGGNIYDLIVLSGLMAWFVIRPGLLPLIGSLLFSLMTTAVGIILIIGGDVGIISLIPTFILVFVIIYVLLKKLYNRANLLHETERSLDILSEQDPRV